MKNLLFKSRYIPSSEEPVYQEVKEEPTPQEVKEEAAPQEVKEAE